ncbi:MAG: hypothetical protein Q8L48_09415 [Archangium sp.]|nr:hypothetical protein [Archangium sp.]
MTTELDPLSQDVLSALDLERRRPSVPDDQLARLAARLDLTFAVPPLPPPPPAGGAGAAKALTASAGGKAVLVAVGLAVGGVTGAQLQARFGTPREVIIERRVEVPVQVQVPVPVAPVPLEPELPSPEPLRPAKVEKAPVEVERLLIEQATAALSRGNAAQALEACTQHAAQFREGQLAEERESLAIRALLRLGRRDEAETRAAAFRGRYPEGLLLDVVEKALEDEAR